MLVSGRLGLLPVCARPTRPRTRPRVHSRENPLVLLPLFGCQQCVSSLREQDTVDEEVQYEVVVCDVSVMRNSNGERK